jgi:hypothetical protein
MFLKGRLSGEGRDVSRETTGTVEVLQKNHPY